MPKVGWYKKSPAALEEDERQKLNKTFRDVVGGAASSLGLRSKLSIAKFAKLSGRTFNDKYDLYPEKLTLEEIRKLVKALDLTSVQIGEIVGCKK